MAQHRTELRAIAQQTVAPDFDNTIAAFDRCGRLLSTVEAVFSNLAASETNEALQAVQRDMAVPLAAHYSAVYMDAALFARVDVMYAHRATLGLDAEQEIGRASCRERV